MHRIASKALANSTSIPSPVVLTIRPRWVAMAGSITDFLTALIRTLRFRAIGATGEVVQVFETREEADGRPGKG